MTFANPLPWWALGLAIGAIAALAYRAYARPAIPLSATSRGVLTGLRLISLLLILFFLMRPVALMPPRGGQDTVVPILVDVSRSMRLADDGGQSRIRQAEELVRRDLLPALRSEFHPEVLTFGERVAPAGQSLQADGRRSDLTGALRAVRDRYRGRSVPGVIVVSDGGDTGRERDSDMRSDVSPVFAIGVGARSGQRDREVVSVSAADAPLIESLLDLDVSVVSHGFGASPIEIRLLEDGRPAQVRRVSPASDGSPVRERFQVSPKADAATRYTVEIPSDPQEVTADNNARSLLVHPPGRRRRILLIQGAPGFEHSFLMRAWSRDPGLEIDSVVRKGQNERGDATFYVQAAPGRSAALTAGYPTDREALFAYDAVVLANADAGFFSRNQLTTTAEFVAERGGGLLVLGARSFATRGLLGTPLEEVLPVELVGRGEVIRTSLSSGQTANKLLLTAEGERHPLMRLGASVEETRRKWAAMPGLASIVPVGGPRPGATVLAVSAGVSGAPRPLLAVQQYGRGRAMIFSGEAFWRWKMLLPSTDRSYEIFWRQVARWISSAAVNPVRVTATQDAAPGDAVTVTVTALDAGFTLLPDASVTARVSRPGGESRDVLLRLGDGASAEYVGEFRGEQPGVYRLHAEVRRRGALIGTAEESTLVGGADLEMADPRLNDDVLRRIASATGGRLLEPSEIGGLARRLRSRAPASSPPIQRDLWHSGWTFAILLLLLSAEWVLRRRVGLR